MCSGQRTRYTATPRTTLLTSAPETFGHLDLFYKCYRHYFFAPPPKKKTTALVTLETLDLLAHRSQQPTNVPCCKDARPNHGCHRPGQLRCGSGHGRIDIGIHKHGHRHCCCGFTPQGFTASHRLRLSGRLRRVLPEAYPACLCPRFFYGTRLPLYQSQSHVCDDVIAMGPRPNAPGKCVSRQRFPAYRHDGGLP